MIKSMTGFGRARTVCDGREVTAEIKAVNHRYFEFSLRIPRAYSFLEDRIKTLVAGTVKRGKIEVYISVVSPAEANADVLINERLAEAYVNALRALGEKVGLPDDLGLSAVARFSEIFVVKKTEEDQAELWERIKPALEQALEKFVEMRELEGKTLETDILSRADAIQFRVAEIERRSPERVSEYRAKLAARMNEVLAGAAEEQRILQEAAFYAEKTAVDEETVRLQSHLRQLRLILGEKDAVGRKLDFLVQEINREANTIGSKALDTEIANIVIEIKSEIEKIREQIQNIE